MKFSLINLLAAASFATAENCQLGIKYCGYNLLRRGTISLLSPLYLNAYRMQPSDEDQINNSIFLCTSGSTGTIKFESYCGERLCTE
ncbi:uncharacterized protein BDR25DRAFT_230961 [Lindgomyces ingoldianus]|uniref:Uncharacterized protein n=1 Tax=Lindgomyces ingoldianus TaxID=673940 RepID=A0ACB6QNV9_9PLEO|nr:uncharacterized protein BDR25DRAFT_230961 [Lindgomyces ingoldianus]KAF2468704.1 hypothetical protein BDR25DRAFT_230961 [Lindgomyces ingoldianus]